MPRAHETGPLIAIGVHVRTQPEYLTRTLASLFARTTKEFHLLLLGDGADEATGAALRELRSTDQSSTECPRGVAACFNRLVQHHEADFYILLENGVQCGPGWLERLISAMQSLPRCGLAGPSTNRAWNEQRVEESHTDDPDEIAAIAACVSGRYGHTCQTLEPLYSLSDFCYVVSHEVVEAIGEADEGYGLGPCWEMDYNIRAHRAGFVGYWVCGSYVHRAPLSERRTWEEASGFEASRRRYQDKFCGLHLRGLKQDYRTHCRGDACANFAPPPLVHLRPTAVNSKQEGRPLVSCIMPTYNRRSFVPRALECFLKQDYPNLELIVVDDGTDAIRDLLPDDHRIRYFRLEQKLNIGAKRNFACTRASGEFIAHWDDDEWYSSSRIRRQMEALLESGAKVCGTSTNYFDEPRSEKAYRYAYTGPPGAWLAALLYRKAAWAEKPFDAVPVAEDVRFLTKISATDQVDLCDPTLVIGSIHDTNTSRKITHGPYWSTVSRAEILALLTKQDAPGEQLAAKWPLVSCIMPTFNRRNFIPLSLDCFRAQTYPNKELIAVDDGNDPVSDLLQAQPQVRYVRVTRRMNLGAKRNLACSHARGEFIAHWDDDDWYAPTRLAEQVKPLLADTHDITGLTNTLLLKLPEGHFWSVSPALQHRMCEADIYAGTLVYRAAIWINGVKYPEATLAEDAEFLRQAFRTRKRFLRIDGQSLFVYLRHGTNTWKFEAGRFLDQSGWQPGSAPPGLSVESVEAYRSACT